MGETASIEVRLSAVEDTLQDIKSQIKEIAGRKVPWIPLIGIGLSFAVTIGAASANSLVQVNLNADRIARNRESIERILEAQDKTNTQVTTNHAI